MCVILANNNGKLPSDEILMACYTANDDGIGLAWQAKDKTISFRKGITFKRLLKLLVQVKIKQLPYVLHFRSATSGPAIPRLCHPFPLTTKWHQLDVLAGDGLHGVIAHNGTWRSWKSHFKDGEVKWLEDNGWSDSSIIAWLLAAGKEISLPISGYGNRLAFLTRTNGIRLWGDGWKEEDGISYSNTFWRFVTRTTTTTYQGYSRSGYSGWTPADEYDWETGGYGSNGWNVGTGHHHKACRCKNCLETKNSGLTPAQVGGYSKRGKWIAQDGTSWCQPHHCFDRCWAEDEKEKQAEQSLEADAAQLAADAASGGECELQGTKRFDLARVGRTFDGHKRICGEDETPIAGKIYKKFDGYLVYTGDRVGDTLYECYKRDKEPIESGNADDRAIVAITSGEK